jgi:mono/diheme cytochrome c family protein
MPMNGRVIVAAGAAAAWLAVGAMVAIELRQPAVAQGSQLDVNAILRCASKDDAGMKACATARELILQNCTSCHTFVPIVLQQFDADGWTTLFARHRPRVPQLSDDQIETMRAYLAANFNAATPPPELPADLLQNWTSY